MQPVAAPGMAELPFLVRHRQEMLQRYDTAQTDLASLQGVQAGFQAELQMLQDAIDAVYKQDNRNLSVLQGLETERDRVAESSRANLEKQEEAEAIIRDNDLYAMRSAVSVDSTEVGDGEHEEPIFDNAYATLLTVAYARFAQLSDSDLALHNTCPGLFRGFEWARDMPGIGSMAKAFLCRPDWKQNLVAWCDDEKSGAGCSSIKAYTSESTPFYKVCTELTCNNQKGRVHDEDGNTSLSVDVLACHKFYAGIIRELENLKLFKPNTDRISVYRGYSKSFDNFAAVFPSQYPRITYEIKSASVSKLRAMRFSGKSGTLFNILLNNIANISEHSFFPDEDEVVIPALTLFKVVRRQRGKKDIEPDVVFLEEISKDEFDSLCRTLMTTRCKSADLDAGDASTQLSARSGHLHGLDTDLVSDA